MDTKPFRFRHGDLVQVAKDLGPCMSHFTSDCRAIVTGTYASKYGGDDHDSISLYIENRGKSSWYEAWQLTLIARNQGDLLEQWEQADENLREQQSKIEWIFENWATFNGEIPSASIESLASHVATGNLWGSNGEGMTWYMNAMKVINYCEPWLNANDLSGFLAAHPKPSDD